MSPVSSAAWLGVGERSDETVSRGKIGMTSRLQSEQIRKD